MNKPLKEVENRQLLIRHRYTMLFAVLRISEKLTRTTEKGRNLDEIGYAVTMTAEALLNAAYCLATVKQRENTRYETIKADWLAAFCHELNAQTLRPLKFNLNIENMSITVERNPQ